MAGFFVLSTGNGGSGGGGGNVDGPASSTDTAFARFSGATGKILKDTPKLLMSDTGMITWLGSAGQEIIQVPTGQTPGFILQDNNPSVYLKLDTNATTMILPQTIIAGLDAPNNTSVSGGNTIRSGNQLAGGTSNVDGGPLTFAAGQSKGTGASTLNFQVSAAGSTGTGINALNTVLSLRGPAGSALSSLGTNNFIEAAGKWTFRDFVVVNAVYTGGGNSGTLAFEGSTGNNVITVPDSAASALLLSKKNGTVLLTVDTSGGSINFNSTISLPGNVTVNGSTFNLLNTASMSMQNGSTDSFFINDNQSNVYLSFDKSGTLANRKVKVVSALFQAQNGVSVTGGNITTSAGQITTALPATVAPTGTTATLDWNTGNVQKLDTTNATGTVVLTLSNGIAGGEYHVVIVEGAVLHAVTWPVSVKWPGGVAPTLGTLTTNQVDMLYDGTNYYAQSALAFA